MLKVCQFLREDIEQELLCQISNSNGRRFVKLKETDPSAAVTCLSLFIPSNQWTDFYVFKLPENLELKKIFPAYNYSCDFILFHASRNIVMLIELKGTSIEYAKKQIRYTEPLISYIVKLVEIAKNIYIPKYYIKRLIVSYKKQRRRHTNLGNEYVKDREKGYTILKVPSPNCRYEWTDLL